MKIQEKKEQNRLIFKVSGRLDTVSSPQLEKALENKFSGIREMVMDFTDLEYISSAGLRVLLSAHKSMAKQKGRLIIQGANEEVREVFEITGFFEILVIE